MSAATSPSDPCLCLCMLVRGVQARESHCPPVGLHAAPNICMSTPRAVTKAAPASRQPPHPCAPQYTRLRVAGRADGRAPADPRHHQRHL
jgi:hypothetical protein